MIKRYKRYAYDCRGDMQPEGSRCCARLYCRANSALVHLWTTISGQQRGLYFCGPHYQEEEEAERLYELGL